MKVRIGDMVRSSFGSGRIIAMSREWCIHEDEAGNEYALPWEDIKVSAFPASTDSFDKEMDLKVVVEPDKCFEEGDLYDERNETI